MFKEPYEVVKLDTHVDPRGTLFEILRFKDNKVPGDGYLYCFTVNPGQKRGGHYHTQKHEWFTCVSGEVVVQVEDKSGNKKEVTLQSSTPSVMYNAPFVSHTFINGSTVPAVVISYGSKQHDPGDPDTVTI